MSKEQEKTPDVQDNTNETASLPEEAAEDTAALNQDTAAETETAASEETETEETKTEMTVSELSKGLSGVFSSTAIQKHQFFGTQPFLWSNSDICTMSVG